MRRFCSDPWKNSSSVNTDNAAAPADSNSLANDAPWSDVNGGVDLGRRMNHCGGMNPWRRRRFGKEKTEHFRECHARIRHPDQNFTGCERTSDDDSRRGALFGSREVVGILSKREVTLLSAVRGSEPGQDNCSVTNDLALDVFGNFSSCKRHKWLGAIHEPGRRSLNASLKQRNNRSLQTNTGKPSRRLT